MAMQAVDSEVARAMEKAANRFLGDRLAKVLEQLHSGDSAAAGSPPD
jgi:hypothetical protein